MDIRVTIESDWYPPAKTCVRLGVTRPAGPDIIPLIVETGGMAAYSYATRDELRALGEMLIQHADAGEVMEVAA